MFDASALACFTKSVQLSFEAVRVSQSIFSALRAENTAQVLLPMIATPGNTPVFITSVTGGVPSTMNASRMPGSFLISSTLKLLALPPTEGHFAMLAYFIPGSCTSSANSGWPRTSAALSTPVKRLPMSLYSLRFLSLRDPMSGTGSAAAAVASDP